MRSTISEDAISFAAKGANTAREDPPRTTDADPIGKNVDRQCRHPVAAAVITLRVAAAAADINEMAAAAVQTTISVRTAAGRGIEEGIRRPPTEALLAAETTGTVEGTTVPTGDQADTNNPNRRDPGETMSAKGVESTLVTRPSR